MFIFTGDHPLRAEPDAPGERGELIQPFEPFECSSHWRDQWGRRSAIGRRIITVTDYERRLKTMTLKQLLNECRRRKIPPRPVRTSDAQWILRPQNAVIEIIAERGEALEQRYGLERQELNKLPLSQAMTRVSRHVTDFICDELDMTLAEIAARLVEVLMAPIREQMSEPEPNEPHRPDDTTDEDDLRADKVKLTKAERRARVVELREAGTTHKDIATKLDVSISTVRRDLDAMDAR